MKALLLTVAALAFAGCESDCECGVITRKAQILDQQPTQYKAYIEWGCSPAEWVDIDSDTYARANVGTTYCR